MAVSFSSELRSGGRTEGITGQVGAPQFAGLKTRGYMNRISFHKDMHMLGKLSAVGVLVVAVSVAGSAQQSGAGPYKVVTTARVGGEGGWDYIYADVAGRRIYIPRRSAPAAGAAAAVPARLTVFNLDTLEPVGTIDGVGGNGAVVDPKSGNGFTSSRPVSMFDTQTLKAIKTIDVGGAQPDGILFDAFNERVYVFSHPTKDATVLDAKDGSIVGTIDLGGVSEQGVVDGKACSTWSCRTRKAASRRLT